jgi:hypothetical protein
MKSRLVSLCGFILIPCSAGWVGQAQVEVAAIVSNAPTSAAQSGPPAGRRGFPDAVSSHSLEVGGATIQVDFAAGALDLPQQAILDHIHMAAQAVTAYYGRFPAARARVLVVPRPDSHGEIHGTTWGDMHGMPGLTRLGIGQHTTAAELADDWVTTHELTHMAFPSLPREQHWMEEGLATYIEPIARVQTGELKAEQIWQDMVHGMPQGEPAAGDEGMDHTQTWGRTYWGGALFCLMADVEIRRQTGNKKGLQDALRAVVAAGGTIDHDWPLDKALAIGDQATGTHVLTAQYAAWKDSPSPVDLQKLWAELGVHAPAGGGFAFDDKAPLAGIRRAITAPHSSPDAKPGP